MICSPVIPVGDGDLNVQAARIVAAAEALAGCRFRLHGRDPATGIDCIGLVLCAHGAAGVELGAPDDYPLRGWTRARVDAWIARSGLAAVRETPAPGDVALIDAGFGQWHFAILGEGALIHADARRRCVMIAPRPDTNFAACWRAPDPEDSGDRPWLRWY